MLLVLRAVLIISFLILLSAVGIVLCLLRPFHPNNSYVFGRIFSWVGVRILGVKLEVEGAEKLNHGSAIYIANHQHNLDLFVCGRVLSRRTVTIGKKSLRYLPFFGQLFWLAGNILIDRKRQQKAHGTMSETTEALTRKNTSIWVFPEGTRNGGKNLLPFKVGAFRMAVEAQAPLIPICVSSYGDRIQLNKWRSITIRIRVLSPVSTQGLTLDDVPELKQHSESLMYQTIQELDGAREASSASRLPEAA